MQTELSQFIWSARYRDAGDRSIDDTRARVARAIAGVEKEHSDKWEAAFLAALENFRFLPGGRILAGAGTGRDVTLANCFVMGAIEDSVEGIFNALKEGAVTMQWGGGVGYDFSSLRPAGCRAAKTGATASGPVSFMRVWDTMCATMLSTGARRGAMMATMRCDHPNIEAFIDAKQEAGTLSHFNLSVLISDKFMQAVANDKDWLLEFADITHRIRARSLWEKLLASAYATAEPGVLFIDEINRQNNLYYREWLSSTNPCGEVPLPAYGACTLGSLNLTQFVREPFSTAAIVDMTEVERVTTLAVRFLDNAIDASRYPLEKQAAQARATRRIGLGVTGLADTLFMLGLRYDDADGRTQAADLLQTISQTAYRASIELAIARGSFPAFQSELYLKSGFVQRLPAELRRQIARHGIRNSHLIAIAPAGTISLLANNVSSGIEPVYAAECERRIRDSHGEEQVFQVSDFSCDAWQRLHPGIDLPESFCDTKTVSARAQIEMQAALQAFVDNAISKTITVAENCSPDEFADIYTRAHAAGLKGCTVFRPNPVRGHVLSETTGLH